jgi:diguanylate cyclase (GGDEF)-like protein
LSYPWLVGELASQAWVYGYVGVSTLAVFAGFGYVLGLQADKLQELARADPLTGLLNRRAFEDRLEEEFARAARFGMSLSLLVLDMDGLKELNDREGHRQGDAALRALALALKRGSRISDIGARWGGDEFVVLAPGTGRTDAFELAERIRSSVASTDPPGLTVSIGLATVEPGDLQARPGTLVSEADTALYAAKRLGRNRVVAL